MAESILTLAAECSRVATRLQAIHEAIIQFNDWERAQSLPPAERPALHTPILARTSLRELAWLLTIRRAELRMRMRAALAGRRN